MSSAKVTAAPGLLLGEFQLEELREAIELLRAGQLAACDLVNLVEAECELTSKDVLPLIVAMNRAQRTIEHALKADDANAGGADVQAH